MKLFPISLFVLLISSCHAQNNYIEPAQVDSIYNPVSKGQPQAQQKPVISFMSHHLIAKPDPMLQVSDYISCMLQDNDGNIWFGTNNDGLCRYDGKNFKYFTTHDGLAGNAVRSITQDKAGNIWLATNAGLSKYSGKAFTSFTGREGLRSNDTWSLLYDSKGQLWVGTMYGVSVYDGTHFTPVILPAAQLCNSQSRFTPQLVWRIFEDKTGNIWFGTDGNGVKKFDGNTFVSYTEADGLAGNNVLSITQDKAGNLWFGTWGHGVSRLNEKGFASFTNKQGLAGNEVWSMMVDKQGYIWMGTLGGGISKFNGASFSNITEKEGRTKNHVQSIIQDRNGDMWFGFSGGVFRLTKEGLVNFIKGGC